MDDSPLVSADIGILILAGGEATRLPGKLGLDIGELPMLARVYRNLTLGVPARETVLSCKGALPPALDALLPIPKILDRWEKRGPLGGLLSTMPQMHSRWIFVAAGDAPFLHAAFVAMLASQRRPADEAVVPTHERDDARLIEPLAALYDRLAFIREGLPVLQAGRGKLQLVVDRLHARFVTVDDPLLFANVNTPLDFEKYRRATFGP
jgi:molybdopterin-guanine dinucleotide biosynthesis protein A